MKTRTVLVSSVCTVCLLASLTVPAAASVDPDAEVLLIRKDCGVLDDCFETIAEGLTWTWSTRSPSAASPLVWRIGPGRWEETWSCPTGGGHVTVQGAGREHTVISGDPLGVFPQMGGISQQCEKLEFLDLTFEGQDIGFWWQGGGTSTWTDVDIVTVEGGSESMAWAEDSNCAGPESPQALHYFFGSRLIVRDQTRTLYPNTAWYAYCSEAWFYGGEILYEVHEPNIVGQIIFLASNADMRVFGSTIRGVVGADMTSATGAIIGVSVNGSSSFPQSQFHMHGGIISLTAASGNVNVVGITGGGNSFAHTPGTAFALKPSGSGVAIRIPSSTTVVQSPFLWPSGELPPTANTEANGLESVDGQDLFVETDCGADGDCNDGGSRAHLMLYNPAECTTSNPWFDVVTGRCRNDTTP